MNRLGAIRSRRLAVAVCLVVCLAAQAQSADPTPIHTYDTEKVAVRLVQIDLKVDEAALKGRALSAKDIDLAVGAHAVDAFYIDRLCSSTSVGAEVPRVGSRPRSAMLLFFDQPHLTLAGRDRAIDLARALVETLVGSSVRGSIVSNANRLRTIVPLTDDPARLIAGLESMRKDPTEFDSYAATEGFRVAALAREPCEGKAALASWYAREEQAQVRATTDRLILALDSLAAEQPPKVLVYFGDTLRQKAGLHYLHMGLGGLNTHGAAPDEMVPAAAAEFDAIVDAAVGRGVHFFTVEAQGLISSWPGGSEAERIGSAEDTLAGLAAETGGEAFLRNAGADLISGRIAARVTCPYILSFPPGDLPRDRMLEVALRSLIPGVSVTSQGRIVIPSESALATARVRAAFVDPESQHHGSLHVALIPRGGDGRIWRAGVQVRLDANATYKIGVDLGASIVRWDHVINQMSGSISTAGKPRPLVLERTMELPPGPVTVVAVAQEHQSDDVVSASLKADWPDPQHSEAVIAPIAALQSQMAAVSTDGRVDAIGAVVLDENAVIDPLRSVVLASVVCRGPHTESDLIVERQLEGDATGDFAPMAISTTGDPCVQIVDVLKPNAVRSPIVDYRIVVRTATAVIADQRKQLSVASLATPLRPASP